MANGTPTPKVPLVPSQPMTEFGAIEAESVFSDPHVMDRDLSYIPGWSEMRRTRDIQLAEVVAGKRSASDVITLPVNMRFARNQEKSGKPDSAKVFGHGRKGFRAVHAEKDKGQPWFTGLPPGANVNADGSVQVGDTTVMVCDRQSAARNELAKRYETENRLIGATNTFAHNLSQDNVRAKGADPTIEKLPAQTLGK